MKTFSIIQLFIVGNIALFFGNLVLFRMFSEHDSVNPSQTPMEPMPPQQKSYSIPVSNSVIYPGKRSFSGLSLSDDTHNSTNPNSLVRHEVSSSTHVPVYFLHIYKSGGTSFCSTARGAGKRVPPGLNCNLKRGLNLLTPEQQLKELKKFDVAANEYDGLPSSPSFLLSPEAVTYVIILRNPLDRFLSHFYAAQVFSRNNQGAFRGLGRLKIPSQKERLCLFHECKFSEFVHWIERRRINSLWPPISLKLPWTRGDFMLRYLVGFDTCDFGECTSAHLDIAKHRLEHLFKVVLILEDLAVVDPPSGGKSGWNAMRKVLGWPSEADVRRAGTHRGSDALSELAGDPLAVSSLHTAVGPHDIQIYEFAKLLSKRGD
jgi:hypothetical protein